MPAAHGAHPQTGSDRRFVVLTSVRRPTPECLQFHGKPGWQMVFVADRGTPPFAAPPGMRCLTAAEQEESADRLATLLPWKHYARKNLGYAWAIAQGASAIFDTDDDNAPLAPWTPEPPSDASVLEAVGTGAWVNVYAHFTDDSVWPRGYPLEEVRESRPPRISPGSGSTVRVWQGLVEGDPDVDAIFRLTRGSRVTFRPAPPVVLPEGSYCPFNSQNTCWKADAFPYLYLPSTVSFRFTDILRGLVAQRCLWAHGWRLGFQGATAIQQRNSHDLLADFRDEIPCYLHAAAIARKLDALSLGCDPASNLRACYEALTAAGWTDGREIAILDSWLEQIGLHATPERTANE